MIRKLIVASNSARRQQLMKEAGYTFDVKVLDVAEQIPDQMQVDKIAQYLAEVKNKAYRADIEDNIILTADTVVICDNAVLGKPVDENEAHEMLKTLSGRSHQVVTGVCISSNDKVTSLSDSTTVEFSELSVEMIQYYIKNYQPFDKAGSYGIQEWLGLLGIKSINGSFYNVMGLPMEKIFHVLKNDFRILPF